MPAHTSIRSRSTSDVVATRPSKVIRCTTTGRALGAASRTVPHPALGEELTRGSSRRVTTATP